LSPSTVVDPALDIRYVPPAERTSRLLSCFDSLAAGENLVLVAGDSGGELVRLLQARRPRLFEWSVLEAGPPLWRIEVCRRAAPPEPRGVREALAWDHERLDALEEAAFRSRASGDLASAHDLYAAFAAGLRRHIGFEEDLLFPSFEERSGMPTTVGPTAVMRTEHREIQQLLERIETGIADGAAPVEEFRLRFHAVMADHNLKEEQVLYPATDELLGPEETDRLVSRIQLYGA
jgi:uncharacterized protein (DUF2249 family)/hemerythrin-like domain-containing protein